MEAWREELYHGFLDNLKSRVKNVTGTSSSISKKGNGLGGGKVGNGGRTWKQHKYVKIENGRYIYPEDLKKGSYQNHGVTRAVAKAQSTDKSIKTEQGKSYKNLAKLKYKTDVKEGSDVYKGLKGKSVFKQAKKAIDKNNKYNNTGNPNSTLATHYNPITHDNITYKTSVQYKNGKNFFDRVIVDSVFYKEPVNKYELKNNQVYEDTYTYEYGTAHQFVNNLLKKSR